MRGTSTWGKLLAALAVCGLAGLSQVSAESLEGSLKWSNADASKADAKAAGTYYWKVWNGALPERTLSRKSNQLLAVLTGKSLGPPIGCEFSFRGGTLSPSTLAARTGTTIRIDNNDPFSHQLIVDGLPGFTPLESGPEKSRAVAVPEGGPWELSDAYYGHVEGNLHSFRELVACARVARSGKFRFAEVPPGPYSLRILRGPEQVASRKVVIGAGQSLEVDMISLEGEEK